MKLFLSRMHFPVHRLGPGRRVGIWFQGCSIRCPGCISVDTWDAGRGATTVEAVMEAASPWLTQADGVTVSGGEPFDQPEALSELLKRVRASTKADVLVYSGYSRDELGDRLGGLAGLIDALITERFVAEAPQTMLLRGSDNQRLHYLSSLGEERFRSYERPFDVSDIALDVMFGDDGEVWMAGIPRRGDLQRLSALLRTGGHIATTTEGRTSKKRPS